MHLVHYIAMTIKTEEDSSIPVAEATLVRVALPTAPPAPAATNTNTNTNSGIFHVDLPVGSSSNGLITFTAGPGPGPVQIATADASLELPISSATGSTVFFLHSIQIAHDLAVSHFHNQQGSLRAQQLLDNNSQVQRRLGLSATPPPIGNYDDGCCHAHTLPPNACTLAELQLTLEGFPPRICTISTTSPLPLAGHQAVRMHQVIVDLQVPGQPVINAQTPGFTGCKIQQALLEAASTMDSAHCGQQGSGVVLTVKDELVRRKNEKGDNRIIVVEDCCVIL